MATNAKNLAELLNTDSTVAVGDIADGSVTTAKLAADAVTAAKLADNSVVTANIVDGNVTAVKTTGVGKAKNHIINGDFSIAQRATSASSGNGTYVSLDRWKTWAGSAATVFSQQTFTVGQTDVPNAKYYARAVVSANSDSGAYSTINQHIENVIPSSGQQMTLSFYAKASSAGLKIGIEPIQNFGSGGSPSARVLINGTAKTLTTSWAKYTHTFTFGSISGKTLGTTANSDSFEIGLWLSGGSGYTTRTGSIGNQAGTFEIANVQLENGAVATDMEQRTKAEELALCQRYFYSSYYVNGSYQYTSAPLHLYHTYQKSANAWEWSKAENPVSMRTVPAMTTYDANGNAGKISHWTSTGGNHTHNHTPYTANARGAVVSCSDYSTGSIYGFYANYTVDAEL